MNKCNLLLILLSLVCTNLFAANRSVSPQEVYDRAAAEKDGATMVANPLAKAEEPAAASGADEVTAIEVIHHDEVVLMDYESSEEDDATVIMAPCMACAKPCAGRDLILTQCGHTFHTRCLAEHLQTCMFCPKCGNRAPLSPPIKNDDNRLVDLWYK